MDKRLATILVSCVLFLTSFSAQAAPVEVMISPSEQTVQLYSPTSFKMKVTNNQDFSDTFQIVVSGEHMEWYMTGVIAKMVGPRSSEDIEISFFPTGNSSGKFEFAASANSLRNPDIKASSGFTVSIPQDVAIKGFSSSFSGGAVKFDAVLQTRSERSVKGTFSLRDSSGRLLGSVAFTEEVDGEKPVTRSLAPEEPLSAGTYSTQLSIGDQASSYFTLDVQPLRSISQKVEEKSGWLGKEVTVQITNAGTVPEKGYLYKEATPADYMTGLMTRPAENCAYEEGSMVCNYFVGEIRPGTTAYVTYYVSYWPAFSGYAILAIIAAGLVMYSFLRTTTPRIYKNHSRRDDDTHNIFIQVRNPFLHRLDDVVVKDVVSPLARVLHDQIESSRPVMRRQGEETELIWKLGEMKPREERILQYGVRPLVRGGLRMPGAHLRFSLGGNKEKRIRLTSNSITLE